MRYAILVLVLLASAALASDSVVSIDSSIVVDGDDAFLIDTVAETTHILTISGIEDGWTVDGDLELVVVDQERKTITLRSIDTAWDCRYE